MKKIIALGLVSILILMSVSFLSVNAVELSLSSQTIDVYPGESI